MYVLLFHSETNEQHGVTAGSVITSQLQGLWVVPGLGVLSAWTFACSTHVLMGFL